MYMFFWFFKQLYYCLRRIFKSGILLLIIFFIAFFFIFVKPSFAATPSTTYDIEAEIMQQEEIQQNNFVIFSLYPYLNNTPAWQNQIKPVFDMIQSDDYDIYIGRGNYDYYSVYTVCLFHKNYYSQMATMNYQSLIDAINYTVRSVTYADCYRYEITFNQSLNEIYHNTYTQNLTIPRVVWDYKSDMFIEFCELINGGGNNYSGLLTAISNYLDSIDTTNLQILSQLNSISSALSTISSNTGTNYSSQISGISNQITDILTDNDTIISQNSSMLQEQQEINDNLEDVNDNLQSVDNSVNNLTNTVTDSSVDNSSVYLPQDSSTDITANGVNNIFNSIYNAFCVGTPQDIVFPIPFTNKTITLSPTYLNNMLYNNGCGWIITIIQAFYWYVISRFIVKDIINKITKIKSGDLEHIQNSNIKGDML